MKLLGDRRLNIAILVSVSWHLLFMFTFSPFLLSGNIIKDRAPVSFLGSILEKVLVLPERQVALDSSSFVKKIKELKEVGTEIISLTAPEVPEKSTAIKPDKEDFVFSETRTQPLELSYRIKKGPRVDFKGLMVTGQTKNRALMYKPELPDITILPSDFSSDYSVTIKFNVSKHGFIEKPECVSSSGNPIVDHLALRHIRSWQFYPCCDSVVDSQEGAIARLNFSAP